MIIYGAYLWNTKDRTALKLRWPKLMEKEGFDTYMRGNWHVQTPADIIFSCTEHIRPGMPGDRRGKLATIFKKWQTESENMVDWNCRKR